MKKYWMLAALCLLFPLASLHAQEQPTLNKKNLVVKEWNTDPKGAHKVLDHVTTYNSDGQKWRKRYEYDVNGRVSKEYVYDNHNRLQTYKTFEFNEFAKKKVQYTYNAKGKLLSIKHYEYIAQ